MSRRTIGYHVVKTGYGLWLPGDEHGSWSSAWDEEIGYIEPHMLHTGDPVRRRMAEERLKHPPVRLTNAMMEVVTEVITECEQPSPWSVAAASIEPSHIHLLITTSPLDLARTAKWLAQQMTKAIHQRTDHRGPVWAKGAWKEFIFEGSHWSSAIRYIERHNERRGAGLRPYPFITPWEG